MDSLLSRTDEEIVGIVLEESRSLEEYVNNYLMKEFGRIHNISESDNIFNVKQELVIKTAYFTDVKKRYVVHIVNKEGISTNKMDVKGFVTRRSDYPEFTKIKIMELLNLLVGFDDKISFKKINKFIEDTRIEILDLCEKNDSRIARPVSFNKTLDEYKSIPYQVKAMQLWNYLEYDYFVPGTKGYLFKIIDIDFNKAPKRILNKLHNINFKKSTSIVIPYEENYIPDYYIVNVDDMIQFAWDNRVDELISPLNYKLNRNNAKITQTYGF